MKVKIKRALWRSLSVLTFEFPQHSAVLPRQVCVRQVLNLQDWFGPSCAIHCLLESTLANSFYLQGRDLWIQNAVAPRSLATHQSGDYASLLLFVYKTYAFGQLMGLSNFFLGFPQR